MRTRVLHCLGGDHAGIKIVRFDASLNFSNSDFFETRVRQKLLPCTRVLVVDGSSINDLDITAVRMLQRLCGYLRQRDTLLLFANWKGPMRDFLQRTAFYTALPPEFCFLSLQDAVYYAQAYIRHRQLRLKHQPQQPKMIEGYPVARTTHNPAAPSEPFYWRGQQQEEEEGKNEEQQVQQLEEVRLQHQERSHQEKQDEWQQGQLEATVVKRPLLMHQFQEKHVSRVSVDAISVKRCYLPCSRFESPEDADVGVADALFEGAQSVQRGRRGRGSGVREEQDREKDEEVNKQLTAHGGKTDFSEALSNRSSHPGKSADGENSSSMSTAAGLSLCLDRTSYSSMNNATGSRRSLNVLPVDHRRTPTKQSRHFAVGSAAVLRTAVSESSALETKTPDATTLRLEVNATSPVTTFPSSLASPKSYSMCKKKSSQPLPAAGGRLERNSRRRKGSDGSESVKLPVTDCWCATPEDRKGDPVSLHRTAENSLGCKNACQLRPRPAQNETAFLPSACTRSRSMSDVTGLAASRSLLLRRFSTCSTSRMTIIEDTEGQGEREGGLQQPAQSSLSNIERRQAQTEEQLRAGEDMRWSWRGLNVADPSMVELVTEVTGGGGCKQWAVLRTDERANLTGGHPSVQKADSVP